jgi:hypothetical protein
LYYHHILPGETLTAIAIQHYGGSSALDAIALHNKIANAQHIVAGRFLELPKLPRFGAPKACAFCSTNKTGATNVDDAKTVAMIKAALEEAGRYVSADKPEEKYDQLFSRALIRLRDSRRVKGASLDMNLAAAEHYTLARWWVGSGYVHPVQMRVTVKGWDAYKIINNLTGHPENNKTTDNPASPPNDDVVRWGLKGVEEGLADRKIVNPKADPPLFKPIKDLMPKNWKMYGSKAQK